MRAAKLERERWLAGLDAESFVGRAAYYVCEINAVHPFREGNGRAMPLISILSPGSEPWATVVCQLNSRVNSPMAAMPRCAAIMNGRFFLHLV